MQVEIKAPYLLFLGDEPDVLNAKTAVGIAHWRPESCVAQLRLPGSGVDLGIPDMTPSEAANSGARSLIWGVASVGGSIPSHWIDILFQAVDAGLDIVAGTHTSLSDIPGLAEAAGKAGVALTDIRQPPADLTVGTGINRSGLRLLTVGTDCAVGKKFTALSIAKEMAKINMKVDFRATGQTGIMIAGGGIPIDAVVSDFVSGAAEVLSPDNDADHWDIIEGQGSLYNPGFAAVTLGLMHGSQPDAFVVCHEAGRTMIEDFSGFPLPDIPTLIEHTITCGRLTSANIRCVGVSVNTSGLSVSERDKYLQQISGEIGLPCVDPVAASIGPLVDYVVDAFK